MDISAKLQLKPGQSIAVIGHPGELPPLADAAVNPAADPGDADAVIAFIRLARELDPVAGPAVAAAQRDRLAWIAYPKAGQLGTDLNRDTLAGLAAAREVQPVRQVAIDATWSALRFRPA
jgi:hypothetical protein